MFIRKSEDFFYIPMANGTFAVDYSLPRHVLGVIPILAVVER